MSSDNRSGVYDYEITEVMRIVDGDTYDLRIDLGFHMSAALRFRLYGYDTPEVYGQSKDSEEYEAGKQASDFVELWFNSWERAPEFVEFRAATYKADSFGRWLADIYVVYEVRDELRQKHLGQELFNEGLAEVYE